MTESTKSYVRYEKGKGNTVKVIVATPFQTFGGGIMFFKDYEEILS